MPPTRREQLEAELEALKAQERASVVSGPQDFRPKQATSPGQWRRTDLPHPLDLPSGNTCLVKRPGMPQLLSSGVLPDTLTPIAEGAIKAAEAGQKMEAEGAIDAKFQEIMADPDEQAKMWDAMDKVAALVVVDPVVVYYKYTQDQEIPEGYKVGDVIPDAERASFGEVVWSDWVDFNDKLFIFQYVVGGSADVAQFRGLAI